MAMLMMGVLANELDNLRAERDRLTESLGEISAAILSLQDTKMMYTGMLADIEARIRTCTERQQGIVDSALDQLDETLSWVATDDARRSGRDIDEEYTRRAKEWEAANGQKRRAC
ncbi:MAG: hypothetical protein IJ246_05195 [Clostridia bacterium]|nr:hypothetical protein [Clostridia bacterium]